MRPILIDTNAYTAFKLGDENILEIIQHSGMLIISPIVIGELIGGFENGSKPKENRQELHQFLSSSRISIYPITHDTSHFYAQVYSSLKRKGKPVPTNDMWIAAQALENGCMVCTFDKHFSEIDGLIVGKSLAELMI